MYESYDCILCYLFWSKDSIHVEKKLPLHQVLLRARSSRIQPFNITKRPPMHTVSGGFTWAQCRRSQWDWKPYWVPVNSPLNNSKNGFTCSSALKRSFRLGRVKLSFNHKESLRGKTCETNKCCFLWFSAMWIPRTDDPWYLCTCVKLCNVKIICKKQKGQYFRAMIDLH